MLETMEEFFALIGTVLQNAASFFTACESPSVKNWLEARSNSTFRAATFPLEGASAFRCWKEGAILGGALYAK